MRIVRLTEDTRKDILDRLLKRSPNNYSEYETVVADIITDVRTNGDQAVFACTKKFDKWDVTAETIRVTAAEIEEAFAAIEEEFVMVMNRAAANIKAFHEKQLRNSWIDTRPDGSLLGQRILPLATSGVYVPGGKAAYPSSVLMNVIPARVAGVKKIVMTTPASADGKVNPGTLVAAKIAGVDEIYKVGGAQAIAAMAFGTQSIPKVDKITGPGNIFVALAKKACFGYVSIDSIAGPSEILVLADETANPRYAAADLLSQAEHDELASAILITTDEKLAAAVNEQIECFLQTLSRKEIIQKSLDNYGYILVAASMEDAIETANAIASEHMEILTKDPYAVMTKIENAGAIFLGDYSSEPLGDYYAGPNHILPTNGTAKFFSPLNVDDFMKKTSLISYSREALAKAHKDIELFATREGLTAHANSVSVRFEEEENN
ncbi:MAG: histidinol dehydrogenase [Lachnospiraceae bacterium]